MNDTVRKLVEEHYPLVRSVVFKMRLPSSVEFDDLHSVGTLGLIKAAQRFKPEAGDFSNYAKHRIRGEVLDELRKGDQLAQSARIWASRIERATSWLEQKLGRKPLDAEICAELNLSRERFAELYKRVQTFSLVPIEMAESIADSCGMDGREAAEQAEKFASVRLAVKRLPPQERRFIQARYLKGKEAHEIGKTERVSDVYVRRLIRRGLERLRKQDFLRTC